MKLILLTITSLFCIPDLLGCSPADSIKLESHGTVPIPVGWVLEKSGSDFKSSKSDTWCVLLNPKTGDRISYWVYPKPRSSMDQFRQHRQAIVHEIFPDGRFHSTDRRGEDKFTCVYLRSEEVGHKETDRLDYSFVADYEGARPNLLIHGTILCEEYMLLIQHTSQSVTTPDLVSDLASKAQSGIQKQNAATNTD